MLRRLKIHRFRHVAPGTELEFSDRYNVLLGKNGTGKTTLLDLISMVLRSDFSSLRSEAFDIEFDQLIDEKIASVRFCNEARITPQTANLGRSNSWHPTVHIKLAFLDIATEEPVEIEINGASLRYRKHGESWKVGGLVDVFASGFFGIIAASIFLPGDNDNLLMLAFRFVAALFMRAWHNYRFDESLNIYDRITTDGTRFVRASEPIGPVSSRWQFGAKPTRLGVGHFYPSTYVPDPPETGQNATIVHVPQECALGRFTELTELERIMINVSVEGNAEEDGVSTWQLGHAEFLFTTRTGTTFNHHALSYGQKRLLAFLYYLDVNEQYVIADELVNGMHHDWIKACLELIGNRQAFLTSQNPLLLDYLPLESAEQIQRSFIQCKVNTSDKKSEFVWSNLGAEDAKELLADYEVGIQHVGELLRVRGLW